MFLENVLHKALEIPIIRVSNIIQLINKPMLALSSLEIKPESLKHCRRDAGNGATKNENKICLDIGN
jgi:hypothetical protein